MVLDGSSLLLFSVENKFVFLIFSERQRNNKQIEKREIFCYLLFVVDDLENNSQGDS